MRATIAWDAEVYPLLFAVAGALVTVSMPRRPLGWLMLFVGACFALSAAALQLLAAGATSASAELAWWAERGSAVLVPATLLIVLLLPDGRLPSPAWRPVVAIVVGVQLVVIVVGCVVAGPVATDDSPPPGTAHLDNPFGLLPASWSPAIEAVIGPVLILPFLLGVVAVVQRLRHPAGDERPRVLLVLAGVLVFVLCVTLPDLLWPASSTWFHIGGVAVMTGTIVVSAVRGQFGGVRVAPTGERPHVRLDAVRPAVSILSPREREVMQYVARGLTNTEIADELTISPITVRNHVSSILAKLDASNRTQAVTRFLALQGAGSTGVDAGRDVNARR